MSTEAEWLISTHRYDLRPLTVQDVTPAYLNWFRSEGASRITSAPDMTDLGKLRDYVAEKLSHDDVLFLGIFERGTGRHIGNVKFEPVDTLKGFAVVGILIGEADARGQGVATEVLSACGAWLKLNRQIRQVVLGVAADNEAAIRAYRKAGFRIGETPFVQEHAGVFRMILDLA